MSDGTSTATNRPTTSPACWPWEQVARCVCGVAFSLAGIEIVGSSLGLFAESQSDELTPLRALSALGLVGAALCEVIAVGARVARRIWKLPPPTPVVWLHRLNLGLLVTTFAAPSIPILLSAALSAKNAQQAAIAPGPWTEHSPAEGLVRISTPPNWQVGPNETPAQHSLYLYCLNDDSHLVATLVPKKDLTVNSLQQLAEHAATLLSANATNVSPATIVPAELNGIPVVDLTQTGTVGHVNLVWRFRYVELTDAWLEVRAWTTASRFETQSLTFDVILGTIQPASAPLLESNSPN